MPNIEQNARNLYISRDYENALVLYRQLISRNSAREDLLIAAANCYDALGDKKNAVKLYKKAFRKNKKSLAAISNLATAYYEKGDLKKAEDCTLTSLKLDSLHAPSWINLGNIQYCRHDYQAALKSYLTASSVKKNYYIALINIANTYYDLKQFEEAVSYAQKALEIDSRSVMAYSIIGNSSLELEKYEAALEAFRQALKLDSSDAWLFNSLSQVCQKRGEWEDALKAALLAVDKSSEKDSHHINFGYLLYECSLEKGKKLAEKYAGIWLEKYPQNPIAAHMVKAVKSGVVPDRANDEYVRHIFDVFAEDFENVLDSLEYMAPQLINGFLQEFYGASKPRRLRILDAGCGTGLCGKFLKKYTCWRGLHGVDLSPKMLDVARAKKVYSKLWNCELNAFLQKHKKRYDLIVSGDVFTYFGDLKILFKNLADSLHKSGRLVFTVSEFSDDKNGCFLHPSGRFLHGENYVKKSLEESGFLVEKFQREKLRNEGEKPVWGFVVSAVKM